MRTVEITRTGEVSVTDQIAEMQEWLRAAGIQPLELEPMRILGARVRFRAVFANKEDAERFRRRFDTASTGEPP